MHVSALKLTAGCGNSRLDSKSLSLHVPRHAGGRRKARAVIPPALWKTLQDWWCRRVVVDAFFATVGSSCLSVGEGCGEVRRWRGVSERVRCVHVLVEVIEPACAGVRKCVAVRDVGLAREKKMGSERHPSQQTDLD